MNVSRARRLGERSSLWSADRLTLGHGQDALDFSQAIEVAAATRTVYCAGQVSTDAHGRPLHLGDMEAQYNRALVNLEQVLAGAGMELSDVVGWIFRH